MLSEENFKELEVKGYTVIPDVITAVKCDFYIGQYRQWMNQFTEDKWLISKNSLVRMYNVGHLEPTWNVRLDVKQVFNQLWKTDKLLTSFDSIAIGRPPEGGKERFQKPDNYFLHIDQESSREGLHAYQGIVYLEEQCEDDWTFQIMEGSHLLTRDFYYGNPKAAESSDNAAYYALTKNDIKYFEGKGCGVKRVPVPKGGMVVWDSRLVHANASPIEGRENPGRWRFTVFVSMTPAIWASEDDIDTRKIAYREAKMTNHWSSQGIKSYQSTMPCHIKCPETVPDIGKSLEARQLSGATPYDFSDGQPTAEHLKPVWKSDIIKQANT